MAGGSLFCWLLKSDIVATLYIANIDPARTLTLKNAIQIWMDRCFPIAVIVSVVAAMVPLIRILRLIRERHFNWKTGATALMPLLILTAVVSTELSLTNYLTADGAKLNTRFRRPDNRDPLRIAHGVRPNGSNRQRKSLPPRALST